MSLDKRRVADRPIESRRDLLDYLRSGEKPAEQWRVGTEHEKISLQGADRSPVPFEGERGIEALLRAVVEAEEWTPLFEGGRVIALEKDGASITLEPGGQLELSGAPLRTIHQTCEEFHRHLELVRKVSTPLDIVWLSLGMHPFHGVEAIPRVPKERYRIMRSYLPGRGDLALQMMHATATVQANFDFSDEADMVDKVRTAMGLSPLVSAIFANSSLAEGKPSGFVSRRMQIWRHTDPDRCGLLPFVFDPDFGYERWIEWALDVPLFFVLREGRYLPGQGRSFRDFLREGIAGERACLGDFELHLTTLFPEVRLKRIIEVRGADAVPPALICALPALWKGLLYDAQARAAAWELVADWPFAERDACHDAVSRRGLAAEVEGRSVLALARELASISREGLGRIGHAGQIDSDERGYLDPVFELLEEGRSPGQVVLERWEGEWERSVERLIEYARYW